MSAMQITICGSKHCNTPIDDTILPLSTWSLLGECWEYPDFKWPFTLDIIRGNRCVCNLLRESAHWAKIGKSVEDATSTTIDDVS